MTANHSQPSAAVSDKGEGMPRAVENTQADLTSCPEVFSQRCLMLPSWLSKLLLCRESPAASITSACNHKPGFYQALKTADACPTRHVLRQKSAALLYLSQGGIACRTNWYIATESLAFSPLRFMCDANVQIKAFRGWALQVLSPG